MIHDQPESEKYVRERIVLSVITNNPEMHHNELIKNLVPEHMAKTTFEKTKNSLIEKEIISVQKKKNMKYYKTNLEYEVKSQQYIERLTNLAFHNLKMHIKKLEISYQHHDVNEKIILINSLLQNILQTDNGFTILDSIKNHKKTLYHDEHLIIQQLIHSLLEIIQNDKDYSTVYPLVISYLCANMPIKYQRID